jgi:aminoglycoside phosphotransferase (APT) family kinase protein
MNDMNEVRELKDESIIGRGRTAVAYDIGDGRILKLFYDWFPRQAADQEAAIALSLNDSGLDVPRCYGREDVGSRPGIVYERIAGRSLLDRMGASPRDTPAIARTIANLQYSIHRVSTRDLPDQKAYIASAIDASKDLLGPRYARVLNALDALPTGDAVCHGDFHPGNVLEAGSRLVVIDWMTGTRGDPLADVARTWLLLRTPFMPDDTPVFMRALSGPLKGFFLNHWYRAYLAASGADRAAVMRWLPPLAAARLRENVPGERDWLLRLIDRNLKA